jgi:hypothetical protein
MTQVGTYTFTKMDSGRYVLKNKDGKVEGTFPTAKAAMEAGVALTAASYKARQNA